MTRVLHVIETLGMGGAERLLLTLLPELARQGVAAEVLALRGPHTLKPELEAAGINVRLAVPHPKWHLPALANSVARAAWWMRADVIHAHLYFPAIGTALARMGGLARQKTAVTFHNLAYAAGVNRPGPGLTMRRRLAQGVYPRGIDLALGVSRAVADHYAQALRLRAVEVSPNPIDLSAIERVRSCGTGPLRRVVLPGRLVAEKGHDLLLAAVAALPHGPEIAVVFAGGGPLAQALQAQAARLGVAVTITGALSHREMLGQIAAADLVVVPSRAEGFGLVALEAMALGKPVIASRVGGLPDVLGDCGLLVPGSDPQALAQAIGTLIADPDRRAALARGARARAATFAVTPVVTRLRHRYETLARGALS